MQRVIHGPFRNRQRTAVRAGRQSDPLSVRVEGVEDGSKYATIEVIPAPPEPTMPHDLVPRSRRAVLSPFSLRLTPIEGCWELPPEVA
jgi:hypothetical protein